MEHEWYSYSPSDNENEEPSFADERSADLRRAEQTSRDVEGTNRICVNAEKFTTGDF